MSSRTARRTTTCGRPRRRAGGHLPHRVRVLVAEREPEPGPDHRRVVRRDDHVVRGAALVDPAGGRRGVQVAQVLGLLGGHAGGLDPQVGAPRVARLRGAEQVADDPAAADRDGAGGVVEREHGGHLRLADGGVLVTAPAAAARPRRWARCRAASSRPASGTWLSSNGSSSRRGMRARVGVGGPAAHRFSYTAMCGTSASIRRRGASSTTSIAVSTIRPPSQQPERWSARRRAAPRTAPRTPAPSS